MAVDKNVTFQARLRAMPWHRCIAYYSHRSELVLYVCVLSGSMLWDRFAGLLSLEWAMRRSALVVHVLVSMVGIPLVVVPFWLAHRQGKNRVPVAQKKGRALFLHRSGQVIEVILLTAMVSGFWLVFIGNRGDRFGEVASTAHLVTSLATGILVLAHAWRFTIVRRGMAAAFLAAVLLALVSPGFVLAAPHAQKEGLPPAQRSSSLVLGPHGALLYSANFSAGSVSVIDAQSGERIAETKVGKDIQKIALAPRAGLLAATDTLGGTVHLLDLNTLKKKTSISVGGRPFGIVYDARRRLFWVVLFEGARLIGINDSGKTVLSVKTPETPRGLALLGDGRLLVTHAMIGAVSVWDTHETTPVLKKTIRLVETSNPDEFVSQGLPRVLDTIAISPDQSEAWLPHILWNFDHPFQFQSTIFPTVSLLSLEPGHEQEAVDRRKHLFLQINILQNGTDTRIVSNPLDAAFSPDGKKVYVTASGSEDLLVFDRSRATPVAGKGKKRRKRRANKIKQGGAKVVQIYRHLAGDNPRGVVVRGQDIFVQNAMSLDMSHLDRGGNGPFARVKMKKAKFADLVAEDPLSSALRQGERLFNSGNTDDFPETPMAGDNWMSCQSCHVDGFNFTNGYLFRDTQRDHSKNAMTGHEGLKGMVAGDFIADYLNMVRDTQGGMGADTRFGTPDTDPERPSDTARVMMEDLHTYVTANENLPFLATWMRIEANSEDGRTPHPKDWINSAACAECHSDIFDQWVDSNHRLMGESNPYYKVVEDLAGQQEGEGFRAWCMGCHQPVKLSVGQTRSDGPTRMFEKGGGSLIAAHENGTVAPEEGASCFMCHRITALEDAGQDGGANASYTVNLRDRATYIFENDENPVLKWLGDRQINAKPEVHKASYSQPFYKDAKLCATCHGEFAPGSGSVIVNTYGEWLDSPFNRPDDPSKNRTCIDCHMHADPNQIGTPIAGRSTDGGPIKQNVVTHQFIGANYHMVGLRNLELRKQSIALLQQAATLSSHLKDKDNIVVRVANTGAGHKLPTGVADFRQLWLQVKVTDANGAVVVDSGKLDDSGVLDPQARIFRKVFAHADGTPVGLSFWRHEKMLEDTRIPAGQYRDESFALPVGTAFPISVEARLMFRIYEQWVTAAVQKVYPDLPTPEAVALNTLKTSFDLGS